MSKVAVYTSTGMKLAHHTHAMYLFKTHGLPTPISLQVGPTSQCNLACAFCSNVNRERHESLDVVDLKSVIKRLQGHGLKTVEWTGGGDPTLYTHINEIIEHCAIKGLKQGMITNGVALKENISKAALKALSWIRVSLNCLEYVDYVSLPSFKGALGFSFVLDNTNLEKNREVLEKVRWYVTKYKAQYVRLVPNCQATDEEQDQNNRVLPGIAEEMGDPFFYQAKIFRRPEKCYWCYFKPFILHDGYAYPCSSVVLNDTADRKFNEQYRWGHIHDLPQKYDRDKLLKDGAFAPFSTDNCDHCVFAQQNDLLCGMRDTSGMEDFV
jgi:MoaA/NifB/PqqE/SkfB family radical SAM enzyme